jgi:hypothetical protein
LSLSLQSAFPGAYATKIITVSSNGAFLKAFVLVATTHFHPSLIFAGKAVSLTLVLSHVKSITNCLAQKYWTRIEIACSEEWPA